MRSSFVYKRHTKWRILICIERRDVILYVDKTFVEIGSVVLWTTRIKYLGPLIDPITVGTILNTQRNFSKKGHFT